MRHVEEFYPEKQGRPAVRPRVDLEGGTTPASRIAISLLEEYVSLRTIVEDLLNRQVSLIEELLVEVKKSQVQLSLLSGDEVTDADVEEEE